MYTIKLKVKDSIYSHLIYLLKNLNQKEIEIVEDKIIDDSTSNIKTENKKTYQRMMHLSVCGTKEMI